MQKQREEGVGRCSEECLGGTSVVSTSLGLAEALAGVLHPVVLSPSGKSSTGEWKEW